jgi:hypothetical protein
MWGLYSFGSFRPIQDGYTAFHGQGLDASHGKEEPVS